MYTGTLFSLLAPARKNDPTRGPFGSVFEPRCTNVATLGNQMVVQTGALFLQSFWEGLSGHGGHSVHQCSGHSTMVIYILESSGRASRGLDSSGTQVSSNTAGRRPVQKLHVHYSWGLGGNLHDHPYSTFASLFGCLWTHAIILSSGTMLDPFWDHFRTISKARGTTGHHFGITGCHL